MNARPALAPPLICKVCDRGALEKKEIYRMSAPVVVIGFLLLIPSILGMLAGGLMVAGAISTGDTADAAIGSGFAIVLGVGSLIGGLLGWLLIMKKRVLRCSVCRATVNAS